MLVWQPNPDPKNGSDGRWVGVDDEPRIDSALEGKCAVVITAVLGVCMLGVAFPLYADIAVLLVGAVVAFLIGRRVYRLVRRLRHKGA